MRELAVVGSDRFVLGFRLAGVKNIYKVGPEALEPVVADLLADKKTGIIIMLNEDVKRLSPLLRKKISESVEPTVVAIGKIEEEDLRDRIKQAVGVDLWK